MEREDAAEHAEYRALPSVLVAQGSVRATEVDGLQRSQRVPPTAPAFLLTQKECITNNSTKSAILPWRVSCRAHTETSPHGNHYRILRA
jgi:hypothetical protein